LVEALSAAIRNLPADPRQMGFWASTTVKVLRQLEQSCPQCTGPVSAFRDYLNAELGTGLCGDRAMESGTLRSLRAMSDAFAALGLAPLEVSAAGVRTAGVDYPHQEVWSDPQAGALRDELDQLREQAGDNGLDPMGLAEYERHAAAWQESGADPAKIFVVRALGLRAPLADTSGEAYARCLENFIAFFDQSPERRDDPALWLALLKNELNDPSLRQPGSALARAFASTTSQELRLYRIAVTAAGPGASN
ncbi:MAG: hypothetical protein ACRD1E_03155, partial [Terriglobales bacterium]